jgi:hypothetical protein
MNTTQRTGEVPSVQENHITPNRLGLFALSTLGVAAVVTGVSSFMIDVLDPYESVGFSGAVDASLIVLGSVAAIGAAWRGSEGL